MSRKKAYFNIYDSYCGKIHQVHDSDIFQLKIGIPDQNNLFATLELRLAQFRPACRISNNDEAKQ